MLKEIQTITLQTIDGVSASLGEFAGKVLLIVNVASKCGLTKQYAELNSLYNEYKDDGLVVLGFPANDFGGQEPGSNDEIAQFCQVNFSVDFPMFAKLVASGPDKHPLYAALTTQMPVTQGAIQAMREKMIAHGNTPNPEPEVLWNFEKFLVSREGDVVARFGPGVTPNDSLIVHAVKTALGG